MTIPIRLKKALADLDPLPRACISILNTPGIEPLTAKKIHQLLQTVGFHILIDRTRDTLSKLAKDGHITELRHTHAPRRYRIAGKYLHQSGIVHIGESAP